MRTPGELTILCATCLVLMAHCGTDRRTPVRYLLPDGYQGWVILDYEVDGAPTLRKENGFYVVQFDQTGRVSTSSSVETGWANDEYFYYKDGWGVH